MAWVGCSRCVYSAWGPRCQDSVCVEVTEQAANRLVHRHVKTTDWSQGAHRQRDCAYERHIILHWMFVFPWSGPELVLRWAARVCAFVIEVQESEKFIFTLWNVDVSLPPGQTNKENAAILPWPVLHAFKSAINFFIKLIFRFFF